jgi:hypothetical protein
MGTAARDWSARERRIMFAEEEKKQEKWLIASRRPAKRE